MLYAAYGSNLHPLRLLLRLPDARFAGTAELASHRLCFHKRSQDKSGKCNIVRGDDSVHIAVYELNGQEKAELDQIEGAGVGYSVEEIGVPRFGECFTYIATASYIDDDLRPYSWYKALVLAGCEGLRLPNDYIAMIQRIASIEDPDRARHVNNMKIVEQTRMSANAVSVSGEK
jgi:Gamma-glutamyl cyclotransferase, AIG2-like